MEGDANSLAGLVQQLSTAFDNSLEDILADAQTSEDEETKGTASYVAALKMCMLELERNIGDIRRRTMINDELAVSGSIDQLKRDIAIKKETITKYNEQLNRWSKDLLLLEEESRKAACLRSDGQDFNQPVASLTSPVADDDDDGETFEEV
ncbi:hypothetical protein DFQ30_003364 [Apophysomyces sp. BC1015]|nr:hypothetical protein DFQ30_003364 [Apophysomyces sp. BC1015]KAG0182992.1 hypothetical protein DFQ29_000803 [Apophysomyces sp. BC1021]